jgi:hypothetical protein
MTYMADNRPQIPADLDYTSDWYRVPDPALQDIASRAMDEGQGVWVTLVVSGALIGGLVESGREFFTSITQQHHDGQELADLFDPAASSPPELIRWERQRERETFESYDSTAPSSKLLRYLHLRDAIYAVPGQLAISLGHTRILLSQVSAWSVGNPDLDPTLR